MQGRGPAYHRVMVLRVTTHGFYCAAGDFHIDPWRPVARALITHGHADNASDGHRAHLKAMLAPYG